MKAVFLDENTVRVCNRSQLTGKKNIQDFPVRYAKFAESYQQWMTGSLVQEAFPYLTASQREFLMTGITDEEWESLATRS